MAQLRQPFLVAAAIALLLAAGLGEENPAPVPPAAVPAARPHLKLKPDVVPGDNPRVDLEVDAKSQLMLAPVSVNGVEGRFVLGTGAPTTLVTPDFAGKTGLDRTAVSVGVVGGGEAKLSRVQSFKVGATDFTDFDVRIVAVENVSQHLDRPCDGIIGGDVLLALPLTLDYGAKRLVFGRPGDLSGRKELPADLFARHLVVSGTVDGEEVDFIIDTGSNVSRIARSSYRGKAEAAPGAPFVQPQGVRLGDMPLAGHRFILGDQSILGIDFFQRYVVTLDPLQKKVYVQTGAGAAVPQSPGLPPAPAPAQGPAGGNRPASKPPAGAGAPAAQPPAAPAAPAPAKPLPEALEKQISDLEKRAATVQEEEYKLVNKIMAAQDKAFRILNMKQEDIDQGRRGSKALNDYKALLAGFVRQLQAFDSEYVALQGRIRALGNDRKAADAKPRVTQLATQVVLQRKSLHDKMADLCEKGGDYKAAIAIYEAEVVTLNELKRPAEARLVKEKLAEAYDKANDPKKAVATLRPIYDAIPPAECSQASNIKLMLRLGFMYEKDKDSRKALEIYEKAVKDCPAGMTIQGLSEKIADLKAKVGNAQ